MAWLSGSSRGVIEWREARKLRLKQLSGARQAGRERDRGAWRPLTVSQQEAELLSASFCNVFRDIRKLEVGSEDEEFHVSFFQTGMIHCLPALEPNRA